MKSRPDQYPGLPLIAVVVALAVAALIWAVTRDGGQGAAGARDTDSTTQAGSTSPPGGQGGPTTAAPTTAVPQQPRQTLSTVPQTAIPPDQIRRPGGDRAATRLTAVSDCAPQVGVSVRLTWAIATRPGTEQRVAITQYADGFDSGRFTLSPNLKPSASVFEWRGLEPGVFYRWRVLTRHGDAYTPSQTATFRGADCLAP